MPGAPAQLVPAQAVAATTAEAVAVAVAAVVAAVIVGHTSAARRHTTKPTTKTNARRTVLQSAKLQLVQLLRERQQNRLLQPLKWKLLLPRLLLLLPLTRYMLCTMSTPTRTRLCI